MSQASLAARAKRGEARALRQIVLEQEPRVTRLLVRILGPRDDLEDLVQIVFLEMCKSITKFRGDSSLSTFVGGITVQVAKRAMRPTAWVRRRGEMPASVATEGASPEENAVARERLRRVRIALTHITKKKRVAFLLYELEGMKVEAIAAMTGSSVHATRAQIYHARKEIRRWAEQDAYLGEFLEGLRDEPA